MAQPFAHLPMKRLMHVRMARGCRYEVILRSGERAKYGNSYPFGLALDINGMPVYKYDSETGAASETLEISNAPDFTSLLTAGKLSFMQCSTSTGDDWCSALS